jgi:transmembrane sensor
MLSPATTVRILRSRDWQTIRADVQGEALFSVQPSNTASRFLVRAGAAEARVLGTAFLMRKYDTDRAATIVVAQGRVAVQAIDGRGKSRSTHTLAAQSRGSIDDSGKVRVEPDVRAEDIMTIPTGRLVFRDTPLRDVLADISRAYAVTVRLADSSAGAYPFSTTVSVRTNSLDDVLEPLLATLGAHAVRAGKTITIVQGRVAPRRPPTRSSSLSTLEAQHGR